METPQIPDPENQDKTPAVVDDKPNFIYEGRFTGDGGDYFILNLVNAFLTFCTLGIYTAWARVKVLKFHYHNIVFADSALEFEGQGAELFKGYLKAVGILILLFGIINVSVLLGTTVNIIMTLVGYSVFLYLFHFAFYSARRYRYSRLTFRGIRFKLEGSPKDFANEMMKHVGFSIISLGLYLPMYFVIKQERVFNSLSWGSLKFKFNGERREFTARNIRSFFFSVLTLGIYSFWWIPANYNFYVNSLSLGNNRFKADIKPGDFAKLVITNMLLVIFTFGIGAAWAQVRILKFFISSVQLQGSDDLNKIEQIASSASSGTGEGLVDGMDMDLDLGF